MVIRSPLSVIHKYRGHILAIKLTITDIAASYGAVRALHSVSLNIEQGQTVTLLGTNGNGKSTLMKCVMGMVRPTQGSASLEIDGQQYDLTKLSTQEIVNLGVAMVPEGRRLFPKLTVEENLLLGAYREQARPQISENLAFAYEAFPVLLERRKQLAGSMSGGQQQMLAIGRGLMSEPVLLIMDEPSLGLSPLLVEQMFELIQRINREGQSILLMEQNAVQTLAIANRAYIIENGVVAMQGQAQALARDPDLRKNYLGL